MMFHWKEKATVGENGKFTSQVILADRILKKRFRLKVSKKNSTIELAPNKLKRILCV